MPWSVDFVTGETRDRNLRGNVPQLGGEEGGQLTWLANFHWSLGVGVGVGGGPFASAG